MWTSQARLIGEVACNTSIDMPRTMRWSHEGLKMTLHETFQSSEFEVSNRQCHTSNRGGSLHDLRSLTTETDAGSEVEANLAFQHPP